MCEVWLVSSREDAYVIKPNTKKSIVTLVENLCNHYLMREKKNGWKAFVLFIILCQVQFALASSHVWQIWVQDSFYVRAVIFRWSESVRGRWTWLGCRKRRVRCCRRKRLESLAVWKWHWFNISQRQISRWRRSDWFYCCWMALAGLVTVTSDGTNQPGPKCFLQESKSF